MDADKEFRSVFLAALRGSSDMPFGFYIPDQQDKLAVPNS